MKKFFMDLFDENSTISSMRFMAVTSLFAGALIALIGLFKASDMTGLSLLVGVFVGGAFGGKVMQKKVESDGEVITTTTVKELENPKEE